MELHGAPDGCNIRIGLQMEGWGNREIWLLNNITWFLPLADLLP